jgi:hypothetical protein
LLDNVDRIHTTALGEERIRRNAGLGKCNIVDWCKERIIDKKSKISRRGKNWYIEAGPFLLTVNASSYTIITVHKAIAKQAVRRGIDQERPSRTDGGLCG